MGVGPVDATPVPKIDSLNAAVVEEPSTRSRNPMFICVNTPSPEAINPKPIVPVPLFAT